MLLRILREIFAGAGKKAEKKKIEAAAGENPLPGWFARHRGRQVSKWAHYLDIYHRHFARLRGQSPVVLLIGVSHGGSLDLWRDYFGPGCRLYGVDGDPRCARFEGQDTKILIGDQGDRGFLARLRAEVPRVDVLIDDGNQAMQQKVAVFEELFAHLADNGVYLCEDLHAAYWEEFGGGYRRSGSFVELGKALADQLNAWHSVEPLQFQMSDFTRTAGGLHFYDSVIVIDRKIVTPPHQISAGEPSF